MPSLFHAPNVYATILEMVRVDGMRHGTHIDDASFMDDLLSDPTEQIDLLTNGETGLSLAELATLSQVAPVPEEDPPILEMKIELLP